MALTGKVGGDFQQTGEGVHLATCISVFDLGTQSGGKFGAKHKVYLCFELSDEPREFEGNAYNAKAFTECTISMHEKATLRKLVESWAGRKFTDEEAENFDLLKLAGKPANVMTVNNEAGYPKIVAIKPVPKGAKVPPPLAKIQTYEMGGPLPEGLPEWLMKKITSAPEFVDGGDSGESAPAGEEAPF